MARIFKNDVLAKVPCLARTTAQCAPAGEEVEDEKLFIDLCFSFIFPEDSLSMARKRVSRKRLLSVLPQLKKKWKALCVDGFSLAFSFALYLERLLDRL